MEIKNINTNEDNSFIHKYLNNNKHTLSFYDYNLSASSQKARYDELMKKSYQREKLVNALISYNKKHNPSQKTLEQIERLKAPESVVVVGGQQAGLFTGPIYTVNKILSILVEAKSVEESLAKPVIPIFWIAGEDHDIDEVNHTFFSDGRQAKKIKISERNDLKQPVSERIIGQEEAMEAVKEAFLFLPETQNTSSLYNKLIEDIRNGISYSDWCAKILHRLFSDTGLVLMDAADPEIREIEHPYFYEFIQKNDKIRASFIEQAQSMKEQGYGEPISIDQENAHLFFHEGKQRFLLERSEEGEYWEKDGSRHWTEKQMLEEVGTGKLALSNNVVTRPVMQDMLLPVHTFIAGPGELKYWGTLKQVFHSFDRRMPLVKPRYHITLLSRKSEKTLQTYDLQPKKITLDGTERVREELISNGKTVDDTGVFEKAKHELELLQKRLEQELSPLGKGVSLLHSHFQTKIEMQLDDYQKEVSHFVESKQLVHLRRLEDLEVEVRPNGIWQERYLNIYPFLNTYGSDLITVALKEMLKKRSNLPTGSHLYIFL